MENTHLVFYPEASEFSKNTYEFEKMGIRLAGCIDEVRWKYRCNALDVYFQQTAPTSIFGRGVPKKYYCTNS